MLIPNDILHPIGYWLAMSRYPFPHSIFTLDEGFYIMTHSERIFLADRFGYFKERISYPRDTRRATKDEVDMIQGIKPHYQQELGHFLINNINDINIFYRGNLVMKIDHNKRIIPKQYPRVNDLITQNGYWACLDTK